MRVLLQWAKATAEDWSSVDSSGWSQLTRRPVPGPGNSPDALPGWCNAVCIQGDEWQGDHYHVEELPGDQVRLTVWNDDTDDWNPGEEHAWEVTYRPYRRYTELGGAYNADKSWVFYGTWPNNIPIPGNLEVRQWAAFTPPKRDILHGIWLNGSGQYEAHLAARSRRGWREWTDGVPDDYCDEDGRVKDQRRMGLYRVPKGTRTYYASDTTAAYAVDVAQFETVLELSPSGSPVNQQATGVGGNGDTCFLRITPASEPDSAAWPTGEYRHQLDISLVGADLVFGLLDLGSQGTGHFGRFNAAADTLLESNPQDEASFVGAGLHLATYTGSWTAGSASDRFGIQVAAQRVSGHGNQAITNQVNEADDFADGPWAAAVATDDALFFGHGF